MNVDERRTSSTKAWLEKAVQDLRRVSVLLQIEPPDVEGSLFHAHQAAEKALKAFLTWHDVPFRRVHELGVVGQQCAEIDESLSEVANRANMLTQYAWRFRYPGAPYEPELEEGLTAARLATEVVEAIEGRLPAEARGH
ncbi:MAG: HEPN domain-containing protein [Bryobacterales bacterium]|nr:HEPN domain-containing protein [Bryobacterales bacterium]